MAHVGCRDNKQCTGKYQRKEFTEILMLQCHMLVADITDNLQVSNREKKITESVMMSHVGCRDNRQ